MQVTFLSHTVAYPTLLLRKIKRYNSHFDKPPKLYQKCITPLYNEKNRSKIAPCMEVKDIIKPPVLIGETASFKEAVETMVREKTNALLVVDTDGTLVGEVTISELLRGIVPDYLTDDSISAHFVDNDSFAEDVVEAAEKEVQYFMSTNVTPVTLDEEMMVVATKAIKYKTVRIAVVDEHKKPIGIISRRGLKHIISHALGIPDSE